MIPQFERAASLLDDLLRNNRFTPLVDSYLTDVCGTGSHYQKLLAESGKDNADQWLEAVHGIARRRQIADGIRLVAEGMLAMLHADHPGRLLGNVHVIDNPRRSMYPLPHGLGDGSTLISMRNPTIAKSLPRTPAGWDLFNTRDGRLGLRRITLLHDPAARQLTELGLILRSRGCGRSPAGFVTVRLNLEGELTPTEYKPVLDPEQLLDAVLNITSLRDAVRLPTDGGGIFPDDTIGFPDASDFIAGNLERLSRYLKELAEMLSTPGQT